MTCNKLPIIGKIYKRKLNKMTYVCIAFDGIRSWKFVEVNDWYLNPLVFFQGTIIDEFEELPEQEPTREELILKHQGANLKMKAQAEHIKILQGKATDHFVDVNKKGGDKVKEALEELTPILKSPEMFEDAYGEAFEASKNLINALEQQKGENNDK